MQGRRTTSSASSCSGRRELHQPAQRRIRVGEGNRRRARRTTSSSARAEKQLFPWLSAAGSERRDATRRRRRRDARHRRVAEDVGRRSELYVADRNPASGDDFAFFCWMPCVAAPAVVRRPTPAARTLAICFSFSVASRAYRLGGGDVFVPPERVAAPIRTHRRPPRCLRGRPLPRGAAGFAARAGADAPLDTDGGTAARVPRRASPSRTNRVARVSAAPRRPGRTRRRGALQRPDGSRSASPVSRV